ncbi:MAG: DUF5063 domain-containing protein [Bacteroides sp.]|jgi:chromatin segregation and condensation protein Rec8/ScpA/Scc1 (kleisin family)|nr:DUF5063 domain-containing protein [Bacteroides sp.]
MEAFDSDDLTLSKAAIEMLTVANEYCLFFEDAEKFKAEDILTYFQRLAPLLYLKGSLLPVTEVEDEDFAERFVTEEQWEEIFKALREKLGPEERYYVHDHNYDTQEASLADNMADIYQDMKDFVMAYQKNTLPARQNALAMFGGLFASHWGPIVLHALGAIHRLLYKDALDPDLFEGEEPSLL